MLYYYLDGLDKKGPDTSEELKVRDVTPETLVFSDGMSSWKPIKEVDLLNSILFEQITPKETNTSKTSEATKRISETTLSDIPKETEVAKENSKIKIPSIIFLFLIYGLCIGITYFIISSQEQNDLDEINKKIDNVFQGKDAITDYTFDGSEGKLYDVYLSSFFGTGNKYIVKTQKRDLSYKPTTYDSNYNSIHYETQLEQWNLFKDLVQYYECKPFSGFDVIRLEKNSTTFSIIKSWSGDMAYKVPENSHIEGYSNDYYTSPGYDLPTYRPSVDKCYEEAAKYLTSDKEDKSYEAASFNKIFSFPNIETKFYDISQLYPKYIRLLNKIDVDMGDKNEGEVIDNAKITDATSADDAHVYTKQWIVWYKSLTNTYSLEEKEDVFNKYWMIYSVISIAITTIIFVAIKYNKRIVVK